MTTDKRITYRRRHSYNTRSNKIRKFRTPGGKLAIQYRTKSAAGPHCGDCGKSIQGVSVVALPHGGEVLALIPHPLSLLDCPQIPHLRSAAYARLARHERTVNRPYGGSRCAHCTRERVMRAFILEEQQIVKKMLAEKLKASKAAA
jgi:large subunit ribosomal protein L34e